MKTKSLAVVIVSNGPGELSTWVRPVVDHLNEINNSCLESNRANYSLRLVLVPCPNSTGREFNVAKSWNKFELITNGLLITENLAHSLTKNLDRLIISIEGLDEKIYQDYTNTKINYKRFLSNLKFIFKNKKNCKIHIKIHNNAVKLPEQKKEFFSKFSNLCDEIFIENLVDLWPETDSSYVTCGTHRFIDKKKEQIKVCSQIFKTMQINSDGSVIPCSIDWKAINKIGDVNKENLLSIWNGEKMKNIRINHLRGKRFDFSPCKSCSFNETSDNEFIDNYAERF